MIHLLIFACLFKNSYMKKAGFILFLGFLALTASSQTKVKSTLDSLYHPYVNWYNQSPDDKIQGASVDQAYNELLKDKKPEKKIIVAVIDGGVDINHEDLAGKIWTNTDEIAGNGVDDDHNGYADDMHGWNFIGNAKGENVVVENLEYVRILKELTPKFGNIASSNQVKAEDLKDYDLYLKCKKVYDDELERYTSISESMTVFEESFKQPKEILAKYLKKESFTAADVKGIKSKRESVIEAKKYFIKLFKNGFSFDGFASGKKRIADYLDYTLNLNYEPRLIVGDNPVDITDTGYGNGDVKGERPSHGTFVSGIIAANRGNGKGTDGIASNVEIMPVRVVPDGDERDKDVALGIRYAVDNGAQVINMSFGKYYSLHSQLMDEAIRYADAHNVLMIKSAGNESDDLDVTECFPSDHFKDGGSAKNWITVGATSYKSGKNFCGLFTNYGKNSVDVYAPGVDIVSLAPDNKYHMGDGTSFSGPVVSGVAALVWSYFPELSASELKDILLNSVNTYPDLKVIIPNMKGDKTKTDFSGLSVSGGTINAYKAIQAASARIKL